MENIYISNCNKYFITSDSPVVEWWIPSKSFWGKSFLERNKYFALTPKILFELTYPIGSEKIKRKTIYTNESNIVSIYNLLITDHANSFVYSGDKAMLEDLLIGYNNPGEVEKSYYKKYRLPLDNKNTH